MQNNYNVNNNYNIAIYVIAHCTTKGPYFLGFTLNGLVQTPDLHCMMVDDEIIIISSDEDLVPTINFLPGTPLKLATCKVASAILINGHGLIQMASYCKQLAVVAKRTHYIGEGTAS